MSLKTICQVLLYFESFKNINLEQQGVYMIRTRIKSNDTYCPPHRNLETKIQLKSRIKNKIKSQADLEDNEYKTKSFLVKYNDEEIDLEQIVVFRVEIETMPLVAQLETFLIFDLYLGEDQQSGTQKPKSYQKVDSIKTKLYNIDKGMCSYISCDFSDNYKSTLKFYVMSMMVDIKFRTWKLFRKQKSKTPVQRQKITTVKQYFDFYVKKSNQGQSVFYKKHIKYFIQSSQNAKTNILKHLNTDIEYNHKLPKYCLGNSKQHSLELIQVDNKTFEQYINMYKIQTYSVKMYQQQIHKISSQTHLFFQTILQHLQNGELNKQSLKVKYDIFLKQRYCEFIFQSKVSQNQLSEEKYCVKQKMSLAKNIRKKKHFYENLLLYDIESDNTAFSEYPIIVHQVTELNRQENIIEKEDRVQLIVLQHGFQGSSSDMVIIKNTLKVCRPNAQIFVAKSNSGATDGDIRNMGELLAKQIQEFIQNYTINKNFVLHFIGHSLGGIISRASLKHLEKYKDSFGTFMSLSSPHLSYLNGTKTSIQTGLWIMKKWKKMIAIDQMTMSDHKNMQQTFMFKLSKQGSLQNFKNIVLISSPEDSYVPWHSARLHRSSNQKNRSVSLQNTMVNNILLQGNKIHKIHRISVDFFFNEKNIDSVIGRAAHIRFLYDQKVLKMIFTCLHELFQ